MASDDLATNLYASLVRFCNRAIADITSASISTPTFIDFDAHVDVLQLPTNDVLGVRGFSFLADDSLVQIDLAFGVSTLNDTNLFRQREMINLLFKRLKPGTLIDIVDSTSGDVIGWMKVRNKVFVSPTANTTTRPYQQIIVSLVSSETA